MSQTKSVQDLYAAFNRSDVSAILSHVSDDVDWDNRGVSSNECPWNGNFQGKSHLPEFFKAVGDHLDITLFDTHTFIESGNHVAVLLRIESTLRKNGRPLKNDSVHVWTFNDRGQICKYRHFNDTAQDLSAWHS